MEVIKDNTGQQWELHMRLSHARVIESQTGVAVLSPETAEDTIVALVMNPTRMIDVLWLLVRQQVQDAGLTREEFEDRFDGKSWHAAEEALSREIVNFIQSFDPVRAKLWTSILRKAKQVSELQVAKIEAILDSPEMTTAIETEMDRVVTEAMSSLRGTTGS